ncbi:hypothetical protein HQ571_05600 [Candidatus Kuenenbacteria bacterium]|nr:hypothetical protein [Candidatus Kuenenbacteria bacterium]
MRTISGAAMVRSLHTIHNISVDLVYARMRLRGWPAELIEDIKREVAKRGGPKMSDNEVLTSLMAHGELQKRATAAGLDA